MTTTSTDAQGNEVTGQIKFGLGQINNPTPEAANWIFRGYFIISKAVIGYLGYTHLIPQADIYEILGAVSLLGDPIMLGLSKLFGVVQDQAQPVNVSS